jgi:hypothetical protein
MKKFFLTFFSCCGIFFVQTESPWLDGKEVHFVDFLEDTDPFDYFGDDFITNQNVVYKGDNPISPELLVALLVAVNGINILQQDFFIKTSRPVTRNVLDWPIFDRRPFCDQLLSSFMVSFFWNETRHYNYTKSSTKLSSYLAIEDQFLIAALQEAIDESKDLVGDFDRFDIARILQLAAPLRLEQRRLGLMFQGVHQWEHVRLRAMMPLYYQERDLFLTEREQDAVAFEFGFETEDTQDNFKEDHFISDRLGLGDLRVEVSGNILPNSCHRFDLGLRATVPTAVTLASGIFGSTFDAPAFYPNVDFHKLYCLLGNLINDKDDDGQISDFLEMFFLGAWDRIAAALIDEKLGNRGHLGLGVFAHSFLSLDDLWSKVDFHGWLWSNYIAFEYLLPRDEKRFFIDKNRPQDFNMRDFEDSEKAEDNLRFLEKEFINRLYLLAFNTNIQPGIIVQWLSKFIIQRDRWELYFGSDFWLQTQEHFGHICDVPSRQILKMDICKANSLFAYQCKLLLGGSYIIDKDIHRIAIGFDIDATAFRASIGRDYTLAFHVDVCF